MWEQFMFELRAEQLGTPLAPAQAPSVRVQLQAVTRLSCRRKRNRLTVGRAVQPTDIGYAYPKAARLLPTPLRSYNLLATTGGLSSIPIGGRFAKLFE